MSAMPKIAWVAAICLMAALCCAAQTAPDSRWGCLRSVVDGNGRPVAPCAPGDPLALSDSAQIGAAMAYLGIPRSSVRFDGCETGFYGAGEDPLRPGGYLVTYPAGETRFLAPVTHELAHVMQMQLAGGPRQFDLEEEDSLHTELGADFIAGIVFTAEFAAVYRGEFENNLQLAGRYDEHPDDAHGTPSQRAAAFRRGLYFHFRQDVPDVHTAAGYFKEVVFDEVAKM